MLEHVSNEQGNDYYQYLKTCLPNDFIIDFCKKNDRIGSPNLTYIAGLNYRVSSTSLRYLTHAYLSLKHVLKVSNGPVDIVELGAGYGGLCLAIDYLSSPMNVKINSYTCIDLDNPLKLQEKYIKLFGVSFPTNFVSASTFGEDIQGNNNFLISNYCFSEISHENRTKYINTLIPKTSHGFITWNAIPLFNFGKVITNSEPEYPQTGGGSNLYVYF